MMDHENGFSDRGETWSNLDGRYAKSTRWNCQLKYGVIAWKASNSEDLDDFVENRVVVGHVTFAFGLVVERNRAGRQEEGIIINAMGSGENRVWPDRR